MGIITPALLSAALFLLALVLIVSVLLVDGSDAFANASGLALGAFITLVLSAGSMFYAVAASMRGRRRR